MLLPEMNFQGVPHLCFDFMNWIRLNQSMSELEKNLNIQSNPFSL
jgi:hypothetical protein